MSDPKHKGNTVINADNGFLQPLSAGSFAIGQVDAVNGAGAEEMPFMPTRHELIQLVKYWAREILDIQYSRFYYAQVGSRDTRLEPFAQARIARVADLLGDDVVAVAFAEVENDFQKTCDGRHWNIFKHGNEAEWDAVRDEIQNAIENQCAS